MTEGVVSLYVRALRILFVFYRTKSLLSFVVVDDGEKGPGVFGFTCSCAKHLMGIIDKIIT